MNFEYDINDFELILLPGKRPSKEYQRHYELAYQCWKEVWDHAYKVEFQKEEYIPSDNFTRQDEVLALFYKGECAGLTFFKWVNGSDPTAREDSYFKMWPETAYARLRSQGDDIIICSQFTLNFKFRKNFMNLPWKDLLMGLNAKRFMLSESNAMTATTRLAKNVAEVTYRTGATPFIRNMSFFSEDVKVDIGAWFKGIGESSVPGIAPLVNEIFTLRTKALVKDLIQETKLKLIA